MKKVLLHILLQFLLTFTVTFSQAEVRTWHSAKSSIEGEFIEVAGDGTIVRIRKTNGKVVRIPLEKLIQEDQEFVENATKKNPEEEHQVVPTNPEDFEMDGTVLKKYKGSATKVVIPDGVTEIGENAFFCCRNVTSAEIPESVKMIGPGAFWNCPKLTILAPKGSVAEEYAKGNNIPWKPLE